MTTWEDFKRIYSDGNFHNEICQIHFPNTSIGEVFFDESDLWESGLNIDRYAHSGSVVEVGGTIAAQCTLSFNSSAFTAIGVDDPYEFLTDTDFYISVGLLELNSRLPEDMLPMGHFNVTEVEVTEGEVKVIALDDMIKLDKAYSPMTGIKPLWTALQEICSICGLNAPKITGYGNRQVFLPYAESLFHIVFGKLDGKVRTYRELVSGIGTVIGGTAYINTDNQLAFGMHWMYEEDEGAYVDPEYTITAGNRYEGKIDRRPTTQKAVLCVPNGNPYQTFMKDPTALDTDNYYDLSNELLVANEALSGGPSGLPISQGTLAGLYADNRFGLIVQPFSATIDSAPFLNLFSLVRYQRKDGTWTWCTIGNMNYTLNGDTVIGCSVDPGVNMIESVDNDTLSNSGSSGITSQQEQVNSTKANLSDLDILEETVTGVEGRVSTVEGKVSAIGTMVEGTTSGNLTLPSGTISSPYARGSITLPAGTWLVTAHADFASNATGYRSLTLSANTTATFTRESVRVPAVSGADTIVEMVKAYTFTAQTTLNMIWQQNSGTTLTIYPSIKAIRIA